MIRGGWQERITLLQNWEHKMQIYIISIQQYTLPNSDGNILRFVKAVLVVHMLVLSPCSRKHNILLYVIRMRSLVNNSHKEMTSAADISLSPLPTCFLLMTVVGQIRQMWEWANVKHDSSLRDDSRWWFAESQIYYLMFEFSVSMM